MKYAIYPQIRGKDENALKKHRHHYENVDTDLKGFIEYVCVKGCAYSSQFEGARVSKEAFKGASIVSLDFDGGIALEDVLNNPFVIENALLVYTTPSHQKDGNGDRFRVVFSLDTPITHPGEYKRITHQLFILFPDADKACSDPARLFYGSPNCHYYDFGKTLNRNQLPELPKESPNQSHKRERASVDIAEIKKMLNHIPANCPYAVWRSIVWAVIHEIGEEQGIEILEKWAPSSDGGGHLQELARRCDGQIKIATLIWHAQSNGYKLPQSCENRTSDQIALEDVFRSGYGFVTIGGTLHEYNSGVYSKVDDAEAKNRIAQYFNKAGTHLGVPNLATANKVESALKYVKSYTNKSADKVNPGGLCLKNGILIPKYDKAKRQLDVVLIPHTPEIIFTSQCPVEWHDHMDTQDFDEAANNILDKPELDILLRTLAASIDMGEVRKRLGRYPRAVFLLGVGSNGKDTFREWFSMLFGRMGITSIPIQSFKESSSRFGLSPLIHSRVNWSSENNLSLVDNLQPLKQVITSDPILVEEKYKPPVSITPKCAMLFNVNEAPVFRGSDPAMTSRYAIIRFRKVFTSTPNSNDPNQVKADPRLKDDPEYIEKKILPGFLKRLLDAYESLLNDKIDYTVSEKALKEAQADYSHLFDFIEVCQVKVTPTDKTKASDLYHAYKDWAINEGICVDTVPLQWHDPNPPYDTAIRSLHSLKRRLSQVIPNFEATKSSDGTYYNVTYALTGEVKRSRDIAEQMK